MRAFLNNSYANLAFLILRLSLGTTMFLAHGLGKLMRFPDPSFQDPFGVGGTISLGLAIFAEVFCAILVVLGLWTRLALIPLIATMAVAFFIIHSGDPFIKKELSLLYLIGFSALFAGGPGLYSVDAKIRRG